MFRPRLFAILASIACLGLPAFGQTFNPGDFGNVTLHLKADTLTLNDNDPIEAWGQLVSASDERPTYVASDPRFNNKPVVKFDGIDDVLRSSSADLDARTVFIVTAIESTSGTYSTVLSTGEDGLNIRRDGTTSFYSSTGHNVDETDFVGNIPAGTLSVNNVTGAAYTAGAAHLVIATAGELKNYSSLWIGDAGNASPRFLKGSVAEVIVYSGVLNSTNISRIGYYLQTKYGLSTTFPVPPPTIANFSASAESGISSKVGIQSTAGSNVTLSWDVSYTDTVSIDQGALANSPNPVGSVVVAPTTTTTYTLSATSTLGTTTRQITVHIGATPQPPRINEFMADNEETLADVDGAYSDWIEIFNPNPYAIDLAGLRMKNNVGQWDFPTGSFIEANGYRVVFASGKNRTNPAAELHTNFSLNNAGENLSLIRISDNAVLTEFAPYPKQFADASYGYWSTPTQLRYFRAPAGTPTPKAANSTAGALGFLQETDDTKFTVGRGFYTTAVTTKITASTPGAKIVYTTNGSDPTETNGTTVLPPNANTPPSVDITIHPGAVPPGSPGVNIASVGGLTTLRVAAFLTGYVPTNVDTQTYLFPVQVLGQTPQDAFSKGWPSSAINGQNFNYGMDPNVVSSFTQTQMVESLQSIPTLSIVTNIGNLVNSSTGIYVNASQHGSAWERPISLEMIFPPGYVDPDGNTQGFQINAGLRIRGGASRSGSIFKHGFRLFFSNKYDGKLNYPLFGGQGTTEFGKLDLGTASNYSWHRESDYNNGRFNTFCRDPFARLTQGALGQPNTKSRYYHLYVNGHYWGVYYSEERAEAEYGASYMGGDSSEYDTVKCGNHIGGFITESTDGGLASWKTLWNKTRAIGTAPPNNATYFEIQGRNPDGSRNPALPVLLDIDNLIDEMLVIFYMGDGDAVLSSFLDDHGRPNNWFSVYRRTADIGFRFFLRDGEHTLGAPRWTSDQTGPWTGANVYNIQYANPQSMHQDLMANPAYKLRFADHVHRHFFNNGALTPANCVARFRSLADRVELAIKAESARWGDAQTISNLPAGHAPRYLLSDWIAARDYVTNTVMPSRTSTVLTQLRADGLYPALGAPVYTNDASGQAQHGGDVAIGFSLRITAPNGGTIYYTLDGSDPRSVSGTAVGQTYSAPLTINSTTLVSARVLNGTTWSALASALFRVDTVPASSANLVVSQVDYNPIGGNTQEFVELMNISAQNLDLTGVHLRDAVDYDFPAATILPPGGRIQVVGNVAGFEARFGTAPPLRAIGPYLGNLSNGGERILVVSDTQGEIRNFIYDNNVPWPPEADGEGYRLVLIAPQTNPNHANPFNWRGSVAKNGPPAASDDVSFTGNASADVDQDGLNAFVEYSLATDDSSNAAGPSSITHGKLTLSVDGTPGDYLTLTIRRAAAADDAKASVEFSGDLATWFSDDAHVVLASRVRNASGQAVEVWRAKDPISAASQQFLRLKVQQR